MITKRRQLCAVNGAEGVFGGSVIIAANADLKIFEPRISFDITQFERDFAAETIGQKASVPGKRFATLEFSMDLQGHGSAGSAPPYGRLLQACGMTETVQSGSAAIESPARGHVDNSSTSVPTVAGTNVNTVNGILEILITAVVTDTSIAFRAKFFDAPPAAPTNFEEEEWTQADATEETMAGTQLSGTTIDFGDPSSSTTGFAAGDRYFIKLTSSTSNQVEYTMANAQPTPLDMALLQDGRVHKMHSCRGNCEIGLVSGEGGKMSFRFLGVDEGQADQALLTGISFPNVQPPAYLGATASLFAVEPECYVNLGIDFGNTIAGLECATETSGYKAFRLTRRDMKGSMDPAAVVFATQDYFAKMKAATLGALQTAWGSVSGNKLQIDAPKLQVLNVTDGDREGTHLDPIEFGLREPEFDAGGDYSELTLTVL